jgi:hypothetical protein
MRNNQASLKKGESPEDVEKMHQAWFKPGFLQVTLWRGLA